MSESFNYPRKLKPVIWEEYVGRKLTYEERCLIERCKAEKYMNAMMRDLYCQCLQKNYYVPVLTNLDGNCLFESLVYHKIGNSVQELRSMLSMIFYIFQDYKNFLPGVELTLSELFSFANEIEYVSTKNKDKDSEPVYYKYSYTIMCQDLGNLSCWSRLPTQLILLVISYLYKIEIIIINSNTGYETKINAYESINNNGPNIKRVYLGHLGESHYVALDIMMDKEKKFEPLFYTEARDNLIKWGTMLQNIKINDNKRKMEINNVEIIDINSGFSEITYDNNNNDNDDDQVTF